VHGRPGGQQHGDQRHRGRDGQSGHQARPLPHPARSAALLQLGPLPDRGQVEAKIRGRVRGGVVQQ